MEIMLGVDDVPYQDVYSPITKRKLTQPRNMTTGQVAEILENHYSIMDTFFTANEDFIQEQLSPFLEEELVSLLTKKGNPKRDLQRAFAAIKRRFQDALANREFDGIEGVPTEAAMLGWGRRNLTRTSGRGDRPSFIDTGLYRQHFSVWLEE
jgi:hypothetical protein